MVPPFIPFCVSNTYLVFCFLKVIVYIFHGSLLLSYVHFCNCYHKKEKGKGKRQQGVGTKNKSNPMIRMKTKKGVIYT